MELKQAALVIVDIVGYTQFIQFNQTSLLHAEAIISELLETVIDKAEYPLTLNKLEGDAALLYADLTEADITAAARDILNQVDAFFNAFHARIRLMVSGAACPCDACQHIGDLKLKAILNKGEVAFKTVRQFQELAGLEVIWVHRLLKNTVPADEYILATEAYAAALGDLPDRRCDEHHEQYPDLGSARLRVYYPAVVA